MFSHTLKNQGFFLFLLAALMLVASSTFAQDKFPQVGGANVSVTASATSDRVRFAAPSAVVQLRLEVYDAAAQKLIDTEQRGGNVLDWHLRGGNGERVADGTYLFVVTIKNLSGRLSQKLGSITMSAKSTTLRASAVTDLNAQQAQAVGPIESGEEGLSVIAAGDAQPVTVLAANDTQAQLARSRGPLTFRFGDFFSGNDQEQMRLTEEGNLGIGTPEPKAKLDVAGTIRAERVLIVKPKLGGFDKTASAVNALATDSGDSAQPLATGIGSQSRIAKWTDNGGTLGDSGMTETAAGIGIGTASPGASLDVAGTFKVVPGGVRRIVVNSVGDVAIGASDNDSGANARLWVDNANGNVGVATTKPGASLDVAGTFKVVPGGVRRIVVNSNGDVALGSSENDNGINAKFWIDNASSNVGIGTTKPGSLLDVAGTFKVVPGGVRRVVVNSNGDVALGASDNDDGSNAKLWVDNSTSSVGIGTTKPGSLLDVAGTFKVVPGGVRRIVVNSNGDVALGASDNDSGANAKLWVDSATGNIGIGTASPTTKLDVAGGINVAGNATVSGNIAAKYQDIAEWVQARKPITANTVVILDPTLANSVAPSARAYDNRVAGVVSAQPGVILGQSGAGKVLVATTGRVMVTVDATRHPIQIGDLLVTSDKPGLAMRSQPIKVRGVLIHRPGTIIGKALEPLANGQGKILVLLSLQ